MDQIQKIIAAVGSLGWPEVAVSKILGNESCAKTLFYTDFLDKNCLSLAISKALSFVITLGACVYKLPMVFKIIKQKGGDGLNMNSLYMETSAYMAHFAYNVYKANPISTYGDLVAAMVQNVIMILLIWWWGIEGKPFTLSHFVRVLAAATLLVAMLLYMPSEYHSLLATFGFGVLTASRLPQIITNLITRKVGAQSAVTMGNAAIGTLIKVFVVMRETNDMVYINGSILAFALNLILLIQILFMHPPEEVKKQETKKTK